MHDAHEMGVRIMSFLLFPACFGTAAIMPVLLPLVYGHGFDAAIPSAEILVATAVLSATTVSTNVLNAMERSDFIFYCSLIGIAISILCGLTVIPVFGPIGAAVSRAVVQLILVAIGQWFLAKQLSFPFPYASIARLLCAALLCALAARFVLEILPSPLSLPGAIVTGVVVYVAAVRSFGALPQSDADRLTSAAGKLSHDLERFAVPMLRLVVRPTNTSA
jgi:O-antigen/teichoic acid export membrane protein